MFLAISTNNGDPTPYLVAESEQTHALSRQGVIDTLLVKADWSGAVMLLDTSDVAAARASLDTLPLVRSGVASFELTEVITPPDIRPDTAPGATA